MAGSASRCTTNADCVPNSRCVPGAVGACVPLNTGPTGPCPTVLHAENANNPRAIFVGAFAPLYQDDVPARSISAIYEMAAAEFNELGLKDRYGEPPSPLVVIVCNNSAETVPGAFHHLIDEVRVPAVLAAMDSAQLLEGFNKYPDTFFVSAFNASRDLAVASDGRAWAMLGLPSDYAGIYEAIMPHIERLAHAPLKLAGVDRKLRVAAVIEGSSFERELAEAVLSRIAFNGLGALQQPNEFLEVSVASQGWNQSVLGQGGNEGQTVLEELREYRPDIVFSFAGAVFTTRDDGVMSRLNQESPPSERPVYILSPENVVAGADVEYELRRLGDVDGQYNAGRVLGIAAAGLPAGKTDALLEFRFNLNKHAPDASSAFNNYYDAFYFMVDSVYASPRRGFFDGSVGADDLRRAMKQLTNLGAAEFDIGPDGIPAVFAALDEPNAELQLNGTMGPPDFNRDTGMRRESGSVYCFSSSPVYMYPDTISYDRATKTLALVKYARCLSNFLSQ